MTGFDFDRLADRFAPLDGAPTSPVEWARAVLGLHYWSAQRQIVEALREESHVAVKAAHGVGKSLLAAAVMLWWVAGTGRPLGDSLAISTAPTATQLTAVVWRELGRLHRLGGLPGRVTGGNVPTWTIDSQIVALGRKPQDLVDVELATSTFQGLHARFPLAVIDEAGGVPSYIFDAVETVTTSEQSRTLAIGNPTDPRSRFASVCAPGSGWKVITVPAMATPAWTGEKVAPALLEMLVSKRWVTERAERWGENSPLYIARVLAEFPTIAEDALVDPADVEAAQRRELPAEGRTIYGVDVARGGKDASVVYSNVGGRLRRVHREHGNDTTVLTGIVARLMRETPGSIAWVDTTGVGAGVFDRLRELGLPVRAFVAAARPQDTTRFTNARAEVAWAFREALEKGLVDLDPHDDDLAGELVAQTWGIASAGRTALAPKSDQAKSPDHFDAAAMTFAAAPKKSQFVFAALGRGKGDPLTCALTEQGSGIALADDHPNSNWMRRQW